MVMGPTHAMSGAAAWLGAVALSAPFLPALSPAEVAVGAAVCAGSALVNDLDCPGSMSLKDGSTVVRAFGVLGEVVGHSLSAISLWVYDLTKSRYDSPRTNGHRTLTHTAVFSLGLGLLVSAGAALPGSFQALGRDWSIGGAVSLGVMWACLHLALFGLAEKWTKSIRRRFGLLAVMGVSGVLTAVTALLLPGDGRTLPWLGLAVGAGTVMHCLGDAITKAGVPFLWPVPIRGKRWFDLTLPWFMRIRAGGTFEYVALLPALTVATVGCALYLTPVGRPLVDAAWALTQ